MTQTTQSPGEATNRVPTTVRLRPEDKADLTAMTSDAAMPPAIVAQIAIELTIRHARANGGNVLQTLALLSAALNTDPAPVRTETTTPHAGTADDDIDSPFVGG